MITPQTDKRGRLIPTEVILFLSFNLLSLRLPLCVRTIDSNGSGLAWGWHTPSHGSILRLSSTTTLSMNHFSTSTNDFSFTRQPRKGGSISDSQHPRYAPCSWSLISFLVKLLKHGGLAIDRIVQLSTSSIMTPFLTYSLTVDQWFWTKARSIFCKS